MAGQYFDIKVEHIDISLEQFSKRLSKYETILSENFTESKNLEKEIKKQIGALKYE